MLGGIGTHVRTLVLIGAAAASFASPAAALAQSAPATFKVAFLNIRSGKGVAGLPGHPLRFSDTTNCTDPTLPQNAWGIGLVQEHLTQSIASDPSIVALGLAEAWASVCASPENVRKVLGWKARSSERNGVAMVAKYGFAGPEEWVQLDTSMNTSPADTMWVLRLPVCLDAACATSMNVFAAHWYGAGANKNASYDRQAAGTTTFLQRAGGSTPHVLIGDLNVWDGTANVCGSNPNNIGLQRLRTAGYVDAWPLLHGSAEGFTGMANRPGCGSPVGYTWKRPDYVWSAADFLPVSVTRFAMEPAGDAAPSDHYGLIAEFPRPGAAAPVDVMPPTVTLTTPVDGLRTPVGMLSIAVDATDDLGVARVEIIEDGRVMHTLTQAPYQVSCSELASIPGTHTVEARAYDAAGNTATSVRRTVIVETPSTLPGTPSPAGEIVLYAKNVIVIAGAWQIVQDDQAAGGARLWNPDKGAAKIAAPAAQPANYVELTFTAEAARPYRLWIRGKAERDAWANDSMYVQFSGSVTATGSPVYRIDSTGGTWVGVEDCSGCGLAGWGWQDNAYGTGALGPLVYFAASGPQTIRIQQREDGISIDQIVLSPERYLTSAPGTTKHDATILLPSNGGAPIQEPPPVLPPAELKEIVIAAGSPATVAGTWRILADATAGNGAAVGNPDAGAAKITVALVTPINYVEFTFQADAGREYRVWLRGRADRDVWSNDSVFLQFSGSQDAASRALARIGSTDALVVNLEDAANAGLAGWGWQDTGYGAGVLGPLVMFDATGPQTIRIQTREDGLRIDQIVLSAEKYLTAAPGALKNDTTIVR